MFRLLPALSLLAACNPGGSYSGQLVDGFTDKPRDGVQVLARSNDAGDLTCQVREATTDANGAFALANLCSGATYTLTLGDESLMLDTTPSLVADDLTDGSSQKLVAWRAPSGSGVYRLADDKLTSLRTFSDVATETVLDSDAKVRYPTSKPTKVVAIEPGQRLVIAGADLAQKLEFHPLVPDPAKRQFAGEVSIEDHVYIGVKFLSDTEWEPQTAELDAGKLTRVDNGSRAVQYVPAEALPQGRYAVLAPNDKRTFIFDFGTAPGANVAAADPQ